MLVLHSMSYVHVIFSHKIMEEPMFFGEVGVVWVQCQGGA